MRKQPHNPLGKTPGEFSAYCRQMDKDQGRKYAASRWRDALPEAERELVDRRWARAIAEQADIAPWVHLAAVASELFGDDELERWSLEPASKRQHNHDKQDDPDNANAAVANAIPVGNSKPRTADAAEEDQHKQDDQN